MQALAAPLEIASNRGIVSGGRGELDKAVAHLDERLIDPIGVDDLTMMNLGPQRLSVVVDGGFEIVNGDRNMVNLSQWHNPRVEI